MAGRHLPDEAATEALGAELAAVLKAGDLVRLEGPLGAGKTTLVRGLLRALGWTGAVRSPTFALLHAYPDLQPPVLHVDLYRVAGPEGTGLDDYRDDHLLLVEWHDRLGPRDVGTEWLVSLSADGEGRRVIVLAPSGYDGTWSL